MIGKDLLNYRILEKIGAGGQGTIYKALDTNLNRVVAIKVLAPNLTNKPANLERFRREAQLASSLEHPNICTIYELDEVDGAHIIVMQYVEGRNIRELVDGTPLDVKTTLNIGIQVTDALAHAHASGVIHRDIKAANVMVTDGGVVKVLDFGLAKLLEDDSQTSDEPSASERIALTEVGSPYGTATYAAPEQARGEKVDHRADIFSSGVLLYEMLAGTWPFRGRNVIEVRQAVINEQPQPIVERRGASVPVRLQAAVDRAIAKAPDARYQNIAEFRDELFSILSEISDADTETTVWPHRFEATPLHLPKKEDALVRAARWLSSAFKRELVSKQDLTVEAAPRERSEERREAKLRIAILPFRNLTGDQNSDFLRFALADAVISELARVKSLEVRSSAAILKFREGEFDPITAAIELKVDSVLASSFIREGHRVHVTAQLLSVGSRDLVWSERIQVSSDNVIELQNKIALRITEGLRVELTSERIDEDRPVTESHGVAFEEYLRGRDSMKGLIYDALASYDEYLRGRHVLGGYVYPSPNLENIDVAIGHFRRAVEIDPDFARAFSALGSCYISRVIRFAGYSKDYDMAKDAFDRALTIDPANIEAKVNLVFFQMAQGLKERAREEIAQLLNRAPSDASVNFVNSYLNRLDGEYEEALDSLDHVLRLNPDASTIVSYNRARIFIFQGHYDKALQELDEGEKHSPDHALIKTFRAMCLLLQDKAAQATDLLREALERNPELEGIRPHLGMCLAAMGDEQGARAEITDKVKEMANVSHDIPYWLATLYAMLGDDDDAFHWLEKTIELGNENLPWFERNPLWLRLRDDPRFVQLMSTLHEQRKLRLGI